MPHNSVYYDTCVFEESLNTAHPQNRACIAILDHNKISWTICICSEISANESSIGEYIKQCEVLWVANGIELSKVTLKMAKQSQKRFLGLKKCLEQLGLVKNDWNHLMAAHSVKAEVLCSLDDDFWDPQNKRHKKQARCSDRVKRVIENAVPLLIRSPSQVAAA